MAETVKEAIAALEAAEAKLASATTIKEKIAASKEAAEARKDLATANRSTSGLVRETTDPEIAREQAIANAIAQAREQYGPAAANIQFDVDPATGRTYVKGFLTGAKGETFTPGVSISSPYGSFAGFEIADAARNERIRTLITGLLESDQGWVKSFTREDDPRFSTEDISKAGDWRKQLSNTAWAYSSAGAMPVLRRQDPDNPNNYQFVLTDGSIVSLSKDYGTDRQMAMGAGGGAVNTAASMVNPFQAGTQDFAAFEERRSAYTLLYDQFAQYGLQSLVQPLQGLIMEGISPAEFTIRLRETDSYKKRFAANQARIQRGLRALSEAEYIGLEDQYQSIMRNYGLPASYYARGEAGRQEGFERFIGGDVSAAELEDRIQTAQNRVINAAPEVSRALREFYPGISNGDILAYALDPDKALTEIRRKVTAAEIGAGAMQAGLPAGAARAEELGRYGITGEQARAGFQQVAQILPRGSQLSEFYQKQGVSPYTQTTAEQEVFGIPGAVEAQRQRRRLTELETAAFSGQSGMTTGALARDRAGAF